MKDLDLNRIYQWPLKKQLIIFAIIFIVVLYLGYFFLLSSQRVKLNEVKLQEADLKQQIDMAITKEANIKMEIAQYPGYIKMLDEWESKLIIHAQLPEMLNQILKLGANNNINVTLFNPDDEVTEGRFVKVPVKMIAVGYYHQLANFISQLANMPKIVAIKKFTLSNGEIKDISSVGMPETPKAKNQLTVDMTLDIYFTPEKIKNAQ